VNATPQGIIYYNTRELVPTHIPNSCSIYQCSRTVGHGWIGQPFVENSNGFHFVNKAGDTLLFNFNIATGDSMLFFQDTSQQFWIVNEGTDTSTILGTQDSAKFFMIRHKDLAGNPVSSTINGEQIIITKNNGLAKFLKIRAFPDTLQSIEIIGDVNGDRGLNWVSNAMIYDFQPGDVYQFHLWDYFNGSHINTYQLRTVLSRTETPSDVSYNFKINQMTVGGATHEYSDTDTYSKSPLYNLPFDKFDGMKHSFTHEAIFGEKYWVLTDQAGNYNTYCAPENCWGNSSYPALVTHKKGLGLGEYWMFSSNINSFSHITIYHKIELIYFKKNGIEYGTAYPMIGMPVVPPEAAAFLVYPSPASNEFTIATLVPVTEVRITSAEGRNVFHQDYTPATEIKINTEKLSNGLYILQFRNVNEEWKTTKLMIRRSEN
jgi:hypothetical protein